MEYLTRTLRKEIIKGGIVISPRRSGKTQAVLSILLKSEEYAFICFHKKVAKELQKDLKSMGVTDKRIFGPKEKIPEDKKIIVDEFFHNPYCIKHPLSSIHCLIGSAPKALVVFNNNCDIIRIKAEEIWNANKIKKASSVNKKA